MTTSSAQPTFMLLLRQPTEGPPPSPQEMEKIMNRFMEWMGAMSVQGHVVGSHGLDNAGKVLRGTQGASVTDGPHAEAKEIVGGYVLLHATDMDQALQLARGCPGLDYRMAVEVRAIKH